MGATAELFAAVRARESGGAGPTVVKRYPPGAAGEDPPLHYIKEVEIGQRVAHPTLVRLLNHGVDEGSPWIEMEWVEGKSLRQLIRKLAKGRRKLPVGLAVHVAREVLRALDVLHRMEDDAGLRLQLVHGDLSPGNILLGYDGRVMLGDFGDACVEGERPDEAARPAGQLRYMSPEQALGEPLTQASDLFCLGVVLHEMLTGQPLFAGGTEAIVLTRVKGASVEPPSRANPELPAALDRLVMATLAPFVDDRPTTARSLWMALADFEAEGGAEGQRDLLSRVMRRLFEKERAVERARLAQAVEELRAAAPAAPARAAPPTPPKPPQVARAVAPADPQDEGLEAAVSGVEAAASPEPPAASRRSRMSLALLSPFQGAGLEAVVVPEIPRALTGSPEVPEPGPRKGAQPWTPEGAAPRAAPRPPPKPEPVPAAPVAAALLIVDSDREALEHFGRLFRQAGYHVDLANGGEEAMERAFQHTYDLVLMATHMPTPNGIQVLKGLRRTWSPPELPVILTSTSQRSQDVLKALSLGANELVAKGIEFNVLHARVRTQIMLKLTYEALQATEARYDALVDHSSDMIFHLAADGRIVFMSPASRAMLGFSPQSLVGRSFLGLLHPPDVSRLREQARPGEALPEGEDLNFRMVHRDRSLVWVRAQLRVTRDRRTDAVVELHGTCREQPPDSLGDDLPADEVAMRIEGGVELGRVAEALTHVGLGVVQGPGGPQDLRVVPLSGPRRPR